MILSSSVYIKHTHIIPKRVIYVNIFTFVTVLSLLRAASNGCSLYLFYLLYSAFRTYININTHFSPYLKMFTGSCSCRSPFLYSFICDFMTFNRLLLTGQIIRVNKRIKHYMLQIQFLYR